MSWDNVIEPAVAATLGGVAVWLFTALITPLLRTHKIRIYRFPSPPYESSNLSWFGFFIRNTSRAKANNVELFLDTSVEKIEFKPPISYKKSDVGDKIISIQISSFPANSQYELWIKSPHYPSDLNAAADGATIGEDFASRVLTHWRGWHIVTIYFASFFLLWAGFHTAVSFFYNRH